MTAQLLVLWMAVVLAQPPVQDGDLTLSVRAGFDGLFRASEVVPVIISVGNEGLPIEGELRVTSSESFGARTVVYSAPVSLPTQSDKRILLYVQPPVFGGKLDVQLVTNDAVVARIETDALNNVSRDDIFYGVVSADPGSLALLEVISGRRSGAEVAFLELADLPDVSPAWNALDVLVLDDADTSRLTTGQLAALRAWVESGGQMVVTGGPGGPGTAAGVADLLPVRVSGVTSVEALPALNEFAGSRPGASGPYAVTAARLVRGELLVHQGDLPLLARAGLGRGSVFFLALDPKAAPLAGWDGQEAIWEVVAANVPARTPWDNRIEWSYSALEAVSTIPSLKLPSVGQLVLFLLIYVLVIGPLNFLVLRRLKRRELAWVTIPALVLLFSAGTYLTGFRTRGDAVMLNQVAFAYGAIDSERLRTQTLVGLYSPRRAQYNLSLPYDAIAVPLQDGSGALGTPSNLSSIGRAGEVALNGVRTDTREIATFLIDAHLPRPAVSAVARLSAARDSVDIDIRNGSGMQLENAVIIYGPDQFALGDMAAGTERSVTVRLTTAGGLSTFPSPTPDPLFPAPGPIIPNPLVNDPSAILGTPDYYNDRLAYPRWQLIQALYLGSETLPVQLPDPTRTVTLGGWLAQSEQAVEVDGERVIRSGATLLLLEIPVH